MKDWFYAFFMAWGMFLAIPCPFPRWRESARGRMLMCLPLIGLVEGGLWALLVWLLAKLCLPEALGALCAAAFPWLVTGFLHLDGYMDVCDAVLSRRDLATRQKILKDSHCGAFAVIAMVLLALTQWIVCQSVSLNETPLLPLAALPCAVMKQRKLLLMPIKVRLNRSYIISLITPLNLVLMILKLLSDYTTIVANYSALSKTMELVFPMIILIKSGSVFIRQTLQEVWIKPVPGLGFPL